MREFLIVNQRRAFLNVILERLITALLRGLAESLKSADGFFLVRSDSLTAPEEGGLFHRVFYRA